jgi:hypothetical protein
VIFFITSVLYASMYVMYCLRIVYCSRIMHIEFEKCQLPSYRRKSFSGMGL